jgi:hypothetical protein
MEVLNAFNVASTFKGEVMLNREEIQDRIGETIQSTYIFNTSDNFTFLDSIEYKIIPSV